MKKLIRYNSANHNFNMFDEIVESEDGEYVKLEDVEELLPECLNMIKYKKLYNIIKESVIVDRTDKNKCWHECYFYSSHMYACHLFSGNTEHARCQSCIDIFY